MENNLRHSRPQEFEVYFFIYTTKPQIEAKVVADAFSHKSLGARDGVVSRGGRC